MRRREAIMLLGSTAIWPCAARAQQQPPALPVIGFLNSQSPEGFMEPLRGFRQGLKEAGFADGENVAIEYRWAENHPERLSALAAELVRRRVAVITAMGSATTVEAKAATSTIPIVFNVGDDPVRLGLVASIARPGGNLTGVNFFTAELTAKRLEFLRELIPEAVRVAVLVNPAEPTITGSALRDVEPAARSMGLQVQILNASTSGEINAAFAGFVHVRPHALFVGPGPFFAARRVQLTQLAARHAVPAIFAQRHFADVGGLISYGASNTDAWRQVGAYTGMVLKGAKPADLPVVQSHKFELVINAETARMLGLTVPPTLLARADEVIE
jgi:putative ABC transport system substrate-binding protein